ncbi:N-acetyltransferase [Shewanella canadensis]|uniref:N-acetyltransferase n=1 Tax=Shewanella canadensis TaxID=271096 RepID=A0A3S0K7G4_9GAMM|nr:GNAT family N-acetyltransferase [Shewanella canadensis]RTR37291.1 N-acetyltransferase [Shewanella canadensis]
MNTSDIEIVHLIDEHEFVINIGQGQAQARLSYKLFDGRINFTHTFVPTELRGKGLAEKLVRHGLSWANSEKLIIETSCWYVQKFL